MEHLYERLKRYCQGEDYPLHMPGHKRRTVGEMPPECYAMDITEIDDFDDLHAPEGILRELQERIARQYGADESFCLVNGSTSGILSAISATVPEGGKILMARNCHKSACHAAYLRDLRVNWLIPDVISDFCVCDGIRPEQVRRALEEDSEISAVLIVSPTYEGRISPVREIARVVHEFGKILIVDEAHGAHLGLAGRKKGACAAAEESRTCKDAEGMEFWNENGCQAGADLVIHSVHKTLPAMTQTALLHVNGTLVDRERLRRYLRIYQSSSPSYVLMASIDNAITMMERDGERLFHDFYAEFSKLTKDLSACRRFRFLAAGMPQEGKAQPAGTLQDLRTDGLSAWDPARQDVGKLVIHAKDSGMTGQRIYDVLREKYHLQLEMAAGEYCLAMFTVGDSPEGYQRLRDALLEMDEGIGLTPKTIQTTSDAAEIQRAEATKNLKTLSGALPKSVMSLRRAWDAPWEEVPLTECEGRIAAEFINLYPPGTPLMAPGEIFSKEMANALEEYARQGLRLRGVTGQGEKTVRCVKEK